MKQKGHRKPGHALPSPAIARMKKVALTLIAQQLKDDDLKELRETFIQLDKNRDGTLSLLKFKLLCALLVDGFYAKEMDGNGWLRSSWMRSFNRVE